MRRDNDIYINWEEVHAISHGLHDNPHHLLGPHLEQNGVVVNAYVKDALKVELIRKDKKESFEMRASGIADFFTLATDDKEVFPYALKATYRDGSTYQYVDAYCFDPVIDNVDTMTYSQGINYEMYRLLGAHKMKVDNVNGVLFAVWAPNAQRVSVIGDFNMWESTRGLMRRLPNSDIFELFVPGVNAGAKYRYQIRTQEGELLERKDPMAFRNVYDRDGDSVVADMTFRFGDGKWTKKRDVNTLSKQPLNIYQCSFAEWLDTEDKTVRTIAEEVCDYVKKMGYTHIACAPVMDGGEYNGEYFTNGFYAVKAQLGEPVDFMYFVDYMHRNDIGVILEWVPAYYGMDDMGMRYFDGAPVYEDTNILRASSPANDRMYFNYGRAEVSNFLIANAMYWVEVFHVDGLQLDNVASMLYLDYGKKEGEWLPNIYGSNENLDAIEFMKHLNSMMKKRNPGVLMIAKDDSLWNGITHSLEEEGLGFDYKWNMGWSQEFISYMKQQCYDRKRNYNNLTVSLLYAYQENYMYGLSASAILEDVSFAPLIMDEPYKNANERLAYAYAATMPGKKFTDNKWEQQEQFAKDVNALYLAEPALWKMDYAEEGWEWINIISAQEGVVVYARKTEKKDDTLVIVCNFSDETKLNYNIGVPFAGKYKEIFNTDAVIYGGEGNTNPRMRQSKDIPWDAREQSIQITVPAMGCSVFKYNVAGTAQPAKKTTTDAATPKKRGRKPKAAALEQTSGVETKATENVENAENVETKTAVNAENAKTKATANAETKAASNAETKAAVNTENVETKAASNAETKAAADTKNGKVTQAKSELEDNVKKTAKTADNKKEIKKEKLEQPAAKKRGRKPGKKNK